MRSTLVVDGCSVTKRFWSCTCTEVVNMAFSIALVYRSQIGIDWELLDACSSLSITVEGGLWYIVSIPSTQHVQETVACSRDNVVCWLLPSLVGGPGMVNFQMIPVQSALLPDHVRVNLPVMLKVVSVYAPMRPHCPSQWHAVHG